MTATPFPPPGYVRIRYRDSDAVALEPLAGAVERALAEAGSLAAWAASRAERTVPGGRGVAWVADLGGTRVLVRHYRRGGRVARLLGDRYLDRPPRPFAELATSEALRAAGVPAARVVAGVASPARPGYRADLATEWLSPGLDLEQLLRPGLFPPEERRAALEASGALVARAHAAGLDHPDLRPRNVFLLPRGPRRWHAVLLDLDRARIGAADEAVKKKTSRASGVRSRRSAARAA